MNLTYHKKLRKKDLKIISKYDCDSEIKEYYIRYLPNFSFKNFVMFCEDNRDIDMLDLVLDFVDFEVEKYESGTLRYVTELILAYMVYFDVNLDVGEYDAAFTSVLQMLLSSLSVDLSVDEIPLNSILFPDYVDSCFSKFFRICPDFEFDLKNDCYSLFDSDDSSIISKDEFYRYVQEYFDEKNF